VPKIFFPVGLGAITIGLVVLTTGIIVTAQQRDNASLAHTEGTIFVVNPPAARYSVDGKTYEARGRVSSKPPLYSQGEVVRIVYPLERPSEGRIDTFLERWLLPTVLLVIGSVFSLMGTVFIRVSRTTSATTQ
jgi:Protein of unknown function (DUF3592)